MSAQPTPTTAPASWTPNQDAALDRVPLYRPPEQVNDLPIEAPLFGVRHCVDRVVQIARQSQHQPDHQLCHSARIHHLNALSPLWCYNDTIVVSHERARLDRYKRTLVERACAQCGKQFITRKDAVSRGLGKYCGQPCYFAAKRVPLSERFWPRVDRSGGVDSCWLWTGGKDPSGYGQTSDGRRHLLTHRVAWELTNGAIPDGLWVLHDCPDGDNPSCVNPAHLWLGTAQQNTADMLAKGRNGAQRHPEAQPRGTSIGMSKLNDGAVREILRLSASEGWSGVALGRRFGVAPQTVQAVLSGQAWKHVPRQQENEDGR